MKLGASQSIVQSDTGQHYYEITYAPVAVSASSSTAACWIPGSRPRCSSLEAVSLLIEAIGGLLACGGGQLQACCRATGSSGVSGDGGEDPAAGVEGGAVAAYVWTVYEMLWTGSQ